jgi:N-glycosylase/DNA lyase
MPEGDAREPSNWELMRGIESIQETLRNVVTQQVFAAWQEGNERRHIQHENKLTEWIAESRGAHTEIGGEVKRLERESVIAVSLAKKEAKDAVEKLEERLEAQEKAQRESRQRFILAISGMVLTLAIAIASWVVPG